MGLIVRGSLVRFRPARRSTDDDRITLPDEYVLWHDRKGEVLPRCDVYFTVQGYAERGLDNVDEDDREEALDYYGSEITLGTAPIDIPQGPWIEVAEIDRIEYERRGKLGKGDDGELYHHDFKRNGMLYVCDEPKAWKLPLPDGCVLTSHGFVWP